MKMYTYQLPKGERWPVDLAHAKALVDDLVELVPCSPGQEFVQLDEKSQVGVRALWSCSADFPVILVNDIYSHCSSSKLTLANRKVLVF